jgi:phage-related minor tail protein
MTTAGALAARLALDSSGFRAEMASAGTVADKELKKIGRQVQFVNDYIREMAQAQKMAGESASYGRAAAEMAKLGNASQVSAAQTANAMRMLPAQFTDVATQLAGGQNPLLILMQQGGQVKDSFGGIGNTFKALGSMITPVGVAISAVGAAIAVTAMAAFQGSKEQHEFANSLILTGNAAGLTSSSFEAMAAKAAAASSATLGQGKEALQALVSTGRVGQQAIEEGTKATLMMARLTGQSSEEVAKDFARMADGVAKWAQEHNKQYHYLTAAQFLHIKQLEDEGRLSDAMVESFQRMNAHTKEATENLGAWGREWGQAKQEISAFWEWYKNLGKEDTTAEQIADARKRIEKMQAKGPLNDFTRGNYDKGLERLRQELYLLQEKANLEQLSVDRQAKQAVADEKRIKEIMTPPAKSKAHRGDSEMGPLTFDDMWPAANVRDVLKYQEDNMSARRAFFMQERKDAEEIAKQFEKPQPKVKTALESYYESAQEQTAKAQATIVGGLHAAEDAFIAFARTGKLSISSVFAYFAEQMLRAKFQSVATDLIGAGGGPRNFSFSTLFSAATSWFSGFGHANGLDRVPYDGYPAILHKGERVQTALQANAGGGTGGASVHVGEGQVINIGQGVSRAEVVSAIQQANMQTQLQIRRQMRQGVL